MLMDFNFSFKCACGHASHSWGQESESESESGNVFKLLEFRAAADIELLLWNKQWIQLEKKKQEKYNYTTRSGTSKITTSQLWLHNTEIDLIFCFYRPQRSWAKVMFLQVCVCVILFKVGVSASVHAGIPPLGADTPLKSRHPRRADTPQEQTPSKQQTPPQSRHPQRADTPPGADPQEQTPPKSKHPPQEQTSPPRGDTSKSRHSPQEQTLPQGTDPQEQTPPQEQTLPPGADPQEQTLPPWKQTPAYSQQAADTHPTGMHSC